MRVLAWLPALLIAALIWKLSATPDLAVASGWLDTVTRKSAHVAVFGVLCAACVLGLRVQHVSVRTSITVGATLALLYAGVDEYHQSFVPTRVGSPVDVAIDALGVGIASMVLVMAHHRRGKA
ncbi:MAG: VanZ family protein [Actinobacteria bacterium]|nr:VanZ family protein [Actinomycetota bacterium]